MMIRRFLAIYCSIAALATAGCNRTDTDALRGIIPAPVKAIPGNGRYILTDRCGVGYPSGDDTLAAAASAIADMLGKATGLGLKAHGGFGVNKQAPYLICYH